MITNYIIQHDIRIIIHLAPKRGPLTHGGNSVRGVLFNVLNSVIDSPVCIFPKAQPLWQLHADKLFSMLCPRLNASIDERFSSLGAIFQFSYLRLIEKVELNNFAKQASVKNSAI